MIRVLVLARDRSAGEGTAAGLAAVDDVESAGTARTPDEALDMIEGADRRVDAVVAPSNPSEDVVEHLGSAFREMDSPPALVVTGLPASDAIILRYVEAGATAFMTEELSISGLHLVLRLLDRGEVLVGPSTAYHLVRRLHELTELLDGTGLDLSAMASLTPRQEEVLELLGRGMTNREIAERLYIGVGTVKSHVHAVLDKLGVRDREEARKVLILSRAGSPAEQSA